MVKVSTLSLSFFTGTFTRTTSFSCLYNDGLFTFTSLVIIKVKASALGMHKKPYLPAFTATPPIVTSSLKVKVVALLAPVRQTLPKGTKSPNPLRFFKLGRL